MPPKLAAGRAMARERPKSMVTSFANTDAVGVAVAASARCATIETFAPRSSFKPGAEMATAPEQAGVAASLTLGAGRERDRAGDVPEPESGQGARVVHLDIGDSESLRSLRTGRLWRRSRFPAVGRVMVSSSFQYGGTVGNPDA
jgi:hypothetical protein